MRHEIPKTRRLLVLGAGTLGCEIIKNLLLSGFVHIDVVDRDTIVVSNVNNFLFRRSDIGKSKAVIAAARMNERVDGAKVTPHNCALLDLDISFFKQFDLVISTIHNLDAKRAINSILVSMVEINIDGIDYSTIIPLIDVGTLELHSYVHVVIPQLTACVECNLDLFFPSPIQQPLDFICYRPHFAEDCVKWATLIAWYHQGQQKFPGEKIDSRNPVHLTWIYETAKVRAESFSIEGVTYELTKNSFKKPAPPRAVFTNSIVASIASNEAVKYCTNLPENLNNYMQINGVEGLETFTLEYTKKPDCSICGRRVHTVEISKLSTLKSLLDTLAEDPKYLLPTASLRSHSKSLYMHGLLESATRPNLNKTLPELGVLDGDELFASVPSLQDHVRLFIRFT